MKVLVLLIVEIIKLILEDIRIELTRRRERRRLRREKGKIIKFVIGFIDRVTCILKVLKDCLCRLFRKRVQK